jgi:hypothetical protein
MGLLSPQRFLSNLQEERKRLSRTQLARLIWIRASGARGLPCGASRGHSSQIQIVRNVKTLVALDRHFDSVLYIGL